MLVIVFSSSLWCSDTFLATVFQHIQFQGSKRLCIIVSVPASTGLCALEFTHCFNTDLAVGNPRQQSFAYKKHWASNYQPHACKAVLHATELPFGSLSFLVKCKQHSEWSLEVTPANFWLWCIISVQHASLTITFSYERNSNTYFSVVLLVLLKEEKTISLVNYMKGQVLKDSNSKIT